MKLPKELRKNQEQKQKIKTKKSARKKRKQFTATPKKTEYAVRPKKKFTETFAPYAIIIAVVFVVIIIVIATSTLDNSNPYETDMTFQTISGDTIKLADHQGEIVLLFFFDLSCIYCGPEAEILSRIDDDYSNSQLYIVLITVLSTDSTDGLNQFKNDHNLNRPIVRDDNLNSYSAPFSITGTPTTILLDRNGAKVREFIGYDSNHYDDIRNYINNL